MAGRWAAAAIVLTMLGIVGIFGWAVLRPPPPAVDTGSAGGLPVASEKLVAGPAGHWKLYLWAIPGADRAVTVTVSARDLEERPVASAGTPSAQLRMRDMPMAPELVVLTRDAPGFWRGATRVSMAGRWSLDVEFEGASLSLPFEAVAR